MQRQHLPFKVILAVAALALRTEAKLWSYGISNRKLCMVSLWLAMPRNGKLCMQVAFDSQMHELKLLMAADEKLWQLRGSVAGAVPGDAPAKGAAGNSPASLAEPSSWTAAEVHNFEQSGCKIMQWSSRSAIKA